MGAIERKFLRMKGLLLNPLSQTIAAFSTPAKSSSRVALAFAFFLSTCCFGQLSTSASSNTAHRKAPATQPALATPVRLPARNTLPDGFPVRLRLTRTLEPKGVKPGEEVPFVLGSDLYFRDLLLAKKGDEAKAVIQSANGSRPFSRGSQLTIQVQSIKLLNDQELPLRGNPQVRGGMNESVVPLQAVEGIFGAAVFPPAGIVSLLLFAAPGNNKSIPANTLTTGFVDGDAPIDAGSLLQKQPAPPTIKTAWVRIVRGIRGNHLNADLFCNGTPMARLATKHYFDLNLPAGWYRFSIKPGHPNVLIYAVPGRTYLLLSDLSSIHEADPDETSLNTIGLGRDRDRNLAGLITDSKAVDLSDLYAPGTCTPLEEEITTTVKPKP